ncbi:MAG: response regulator [Chloroflexota bacterium]|nr:MAG: response regulator [Chloroflexota bacterium]
MQKQRTILVIDDDRDIVAVEKLILEKRGYRVIIAYTPEEGRRKAETEGPDLILLDIMMPTGTEGFHFVWSLRKSSDPIVRNVPIVVTSAIHRTLDIRLFPEPSDQYYQPGEFLPVQGWLDKPIEPERLVEEVSKVLDEKGKG